MSVTIINPGIGGITVETDPTALKLTGGAISGDLTVAQKVGIGGVVPVGATNKLAVHNGNIVFTSGFGLAFGDGTSLASTSPLAMRAGTTFTGKVNFSTVSGVAGLNIGIGGTDAANTTAGDMWIATNGATLNFRDGTGAWRQLVNTSGAAGISANSSTHVLSLTQNGTGSGLIVTNNINSTLPAVRITNLSGQHCLIVEDSTSPDGSSFFIDQIGNVAIGYATDNVLPGKFNVNGTTFFFGNTYVGSGSTFFAQAAQFANIRTDASSTVSIQDFKVPVTSSGTYDREWQIRVNGINYMIPCRQI